MKKLTVIIISALCLCLTVILSGCSADKKEGLGSSELQPTYNEPSQNKSFYFNNYDEFYSALCTKESETYRKLRNDDIFENNKQYNSILSDFSDGEVKVMMPSLNNEQIPLQSKSEEHKITLFSNELYNLPWIWYYCDYQGETIVVCLTYLDIIDNDSVKACKNFSEVIKTIAPEAPNTDTDLESNKNSNQ